MGNGGIKSPEIVEEVLRRGYRVKHEAPHVPPVHVEPEPHAPVVHEPPDVIHFPPTEGRPPPGMHVPVEPHAPVVHEPTAIPVEAGLAGRSGVIALAIYAAVAMTTREADLLIPSL